MQPHLHVSRRTLSPTTRPPMHLQHASGGSDMPRTFPKLPVAQARRVPPEVVSLAAQADEPPVVLDVHPQDNNRADRFTGAT